MAKLREIEYPHFCDIEYYLASEVNNVWNSSRCHLSYSDLPSVGNASTAIRNLQHSPIGLPYSCACYPLSPKIPYRSTLFLGWPFTVSAIRASLDSDSHFASQHDLAPSLPGLCWIKVIQNVLDKRATPSLPTVCITHSPLSNSDRIFINLSIYFILII